MCKRALPTNNVLLPRGFLRREQDQVSTFLGLIWAKFNSSLLPFFTLFIILTSHKYYHRGHFI